MWQILNATLEQYDDNIHRVLTNVDNPTWDDVRKMVEKLNDKRSSDLGIGGPRGLSMDISGEPDRFLVSVIGDEFGPFTLLGPDQTDEEVIVIAYGVETAFPRRFIVTRGQVMTAAHSFVLNGTLSPDLSWSSD